MIKKLSLYIFIVFYNYTYSQQNLVPNGSFEDTVSCPDNYDQLHKAKFWYKPTNASSDYFNSCANTNSIIGVPYNAIGYQIAKNGTAYAGIGCIFDSSLYNYREYLQVKLSQKLLVNKKYKLKFYISKADSTAYAISNIGALVSANNYTCSCDTSINQNPQVFTNNYTVDFQNWQLIEGEIISNGTEEYLTIGYFKNNKNPDTLRVLNNNNLFSYYYIDDIILYEDYSNNEGYLLISEIITPNEDGFNDFLSLNSNLLKSEEFSISVYNRWGNEFFFQKIKTLNGMVHSIINHYHLAHIIF